MWEIIFIISIFIVWPLWLFIKLARYGQNIFFPNFERMKRKIDEWTHFSYDGFFSYNRTGGKLFYYFLLIYLAGGIFFIIYSLAA